MIKLLFLLLLLLLLQAQRAAGVLRGLGVYDAFIWADISSRAQDTARILANELGIRQVTISHFLHDI